MATLATGGGGSAIGGGAGGGGGTGVGSGETGGGVASGPNGSNLLTMTVLTSLGASDGNVSRETFGGSGGGGGGRFEPNAALSRNGAPADATVIAAHGTHHGTVLGSHGAKSEIVRFQYTGLHHATTSTSVAKVARQNSSITTSAMKFVTVTVGS